MADGTENFLSDAHGSDDAVSVAVDHQQDGVTAGLGCGNAMDVDGAGTVVLAKLGGGLSAAVDVLLLIC